ncbi:MAG: calcium-binding protein [Sulfitobacter sp.]
MTNFVITSTTTTAQILLTGETGYVATDGELVVSGTDAVTASGNVQIGILGNITTFGDVEAVDFDGDDIDLFIGAAGSVLAVSDGALDLSASFRIEVANYGSIIADGTAIMAATTDTGTPINVFNSGTINGSTAISANSGASATYIANSGDMFTNGTSISIGSLTGTTTITNTGTIQSAGSTSIISGGGNDRIVNTGTIIGGVSMGSGNDLFDGTGGTMIGRIDGSNGDDTLLGGMGNETLRGGNDEDELHGGGGNDTIQGDDFDSANDVFHGGDGIDTLDLDGDSGGVTVDLHAGIASGGSFGVDTLISIENVQTGFGNDLIIGNDVDNVLNGGFGDDTLIGGLGADRLIGGDGTDTADYSDMDAAVMLFLDGRANWGDARGDTFSGIENLIGSDFADTLVGSNDANEIVGGAGADTIFALDGNDTIDGGAGSDVLYGQDGNDVLMGSGSPDVLDGGADIDTADYSNATSSVGLRLNGLANFGFATGDTFVNIENLTGSDFGDVIVGSSIGNVLNGGDGGDSIFALQGNDTIIGGGGNDTMSGQAGNDVFVFDDGFGNDTITDFDAANGDEDIDFSILSTITDFAQLSTGGRMTQVGSDVLIDDLNGNTITLTNVVLGNLDASDFIF